MIIIAIEDEELALAALLDCPALAGSLQKGECVSCSL